MKLPFDVNATAGRRFINLGPDIATAILRTVEVGWTFALRSSDVNADTGEVGITERLRDGMRYALDSGILPWKTMIVLPGTESRSSRDVPLPDGRTDISIQCIEIFVRFRVHDPHAIIECKRVAGNNAHLCREYVVEGIDRFRTGQYSNNHSTGFMIGYLIEGDATAVANCINNYLNRKSRYDENLKPSDIVAEPWVWASCHPRKRTSPIALYHAFLAFTAA